MSAAIAYIVFLEVPTISTIYGALIIIPSTLFVIYSEKKEINKQNKQQDEEQIQTQDSYQDQDYKRKKLNKIGLKTQN